MTDLSKPIAIPSGYKVQNYEQASVLLDELAALNDGACYVERSGHDAQPVFLLYQRTLSHWWKEKTTAIAAFFGNKEAIEEIQQFQQNKRDAMIAIASSLGIEMDEGSENRKKLEKLIPLNESKGLKFAEVAKIVAPEAGSLSKLSFEIGGFKDFDQKKQWRRVYVAQRIVGMNPEGARVDEVNGGQYLRTQSMKEAFVDLWTKREKLEDNRVDFANAIATAFMMGTPGKSNPKGKENNKAGNAIGKAISALLSHVTAAKWMERSGSSATHSPALSASSNASNKILSVYFQQDDQLSIDEGSDSENSFSEDDSDSEILHETGSEYEAEYSDAEQCGDDDSDIEIPNDPELVG